MSHKRTSLRFENQTTGLVSVRCQPRFLGENVNEVGPSSTQQLGMNFIFLPNAASHFTYFDQPLYLPLEHASDNFASSYGFISGSRMGIKFICLYSAGFMGPVQDRRGPLRLVICIRSRLSATSVTFLIKTKHTAHILLILQLSL